MNTAAMVMIVHHVDTEGPLSESVVEVFQRLESTLGVCFDLAPTIGNLKLLQEGRIEGLDTLTREEIRRIANPHLVQFKRTWSEIDEMLHRVLAPSFRNEIVDTTGTGWVYNWHVIDHVGFESNPRHRDMGYLNILNHYQEILGSTKSTMDEVHWHFHPVSFYREAHISATSYDNSMYELHQVISRRLLEKGWFPRVNRAGFHTIRPDSNFFLEQWIPFDASNQAYPEETLAQVDALNGRFGDWRGAPDDWSVYHPSPLDWRTPGSMNRIIARTLNLQTRFRNINEEEIERAFMKASREDQAVYLGITNHDFREMSTEIRDFQQMLISVAGRHHSVPFVYRSAIGAFRTVLGYSNEQIERDRIRLEGELLGNLLRVRIVNGAIFGPQPYLAFKTTAGQFFHDNFDFGVGPKSFSYVFDRLTIPLHEVSLIGVASNDRYGNCHILKLVLRNGEILQDESINL